MIWVELTGGLLADERPTHEKCSHDAVYFIRRKLAGPRNGTADTGHKALCPGVGNLLCRLVVVALFAPRRFWAPGSGKRLGWRRYVTGPDPDFC